MWILFYLFVQPDGTSDYSSLPPQQRVRRLQAKLADMEKEREKKISSKEGVVKMQQVRVASSDGKSSPPHIACSPVFLIDQIRLLKLQGEGEFSC